MTEYYFDLETYSPNEKPDPTKDKITTIQYQEFQRFEGTPKGDLQILTEWDCGSEKAMLEAFRKVFMTDNAFDFVPVGINLYGFDLLALISGLNRHFDLNLGIEMFRNKPVLDLKGVMVMVNGGNFSAMSDVFGKPTPNPVKGWYDASNYGQIIDYIRRENRKFIRVYQNLKYELPRLKAQLWKAVS